MVIVKMLAVQYSLVKLALVRRSVSDEVSQVEHGDVGLSCRAAQQMRITVITETWYVVVVFILCYGE